MDRQTVEMYLGRAIDELHVNPLSTQLIRRLATEEPDHFAHAAVQYLETEGESGATRYLSAMLLRDPLICDHLASPNYWTKQQAIGVFRHLLAVDPGFDVKLARKLPDRTGSNQHEAFQGVRAARVLDILDETSRGRRLLPVLGHLVNSTDPRTCAKATLFVGRRMQNPAWAARQLQRSDESVRASVVESMWGVDSASAIKLLETCVDDPSNWVAGNSLVGLHLAGREGILEQIADMSVHGKPQFRATAAWAMGRVGDPIFAPILNILVKDEDPTVRSNALRSLIELRKTEVRPEEIVAEPVPVADVLPEPAVEPESAAEPEEMLPQSPVFELRLDGSSFSTARP